MGGTIKTISQYEKAIDLMLRRGGSQIVDYYYRGQADVKWELKSSLERVSGSKVRLLDYYQKIERYKSKINAFKQGKPFDFVKIADHFILHENNPKNFYLPDSSYLAYLRHYGFPTPILDWTHSKYVALYFACEDYATSKTDGSVHLYFETFDSEYVSLGESRIVTINPAINLPKRHFIQQSYYLSGIRYVENEIALFGKGDWYFMPLKDCGAIVSKFVIEKESKANIACQLREMGITRESLFMDEDSLMKGLGDEFIDKEKDFERKWAETLKKQKERTKK